MYIYIYVHILTYMYMYANTERERNRAPVAREAFRVRVPGMEIAKLTGMPTLEDGQRQLQLQRVLQLQVAAQQVPVQADDFFEEDAVRKTCWATVSHGTWQKSSSTITLKGATCPGRVQISA